MPPIVLSSFSNNKVSFFVFGLSSWISPYTSASAGESLEKRLSNFLATQGRLERREELHETKSFFLKNLLTCETRLEPRPRAGSQPTGTLSSTNRPGASPSSSTSWVSSSVCREANRLEAEGQPIVSNEHWTAVSWSGSFLLFEIKTWVFIDLLPLLERLGSSNVWVYSPLTSVQSLVFPLGLFSKVWFSKSFLQTPSARAF